MEPIANARRHSTTDGKGARTCFQWDGKPDPFRPTKKFFPQATERDINVFRTATPFDKLYEEREIPLRVGGVKVFPEITERILHGEGGDGVDFAGAAKASAASESPRGRTPRQTCAQMWKWQRRELRLTYGMSQKDLEKKTERQRVRSRQGAIEKRWEQARKMREADLKVIHDRSAPPLKNHRIVLPAHRLPPPPPPPAHGRPLSARVKSRIAEIADTFLKGASTSRSVSTEINTAKTCTDVRTNEMSTTSIPKPVVVVPVRPATAKPVSNRPSSRRVNIRD